MTLLTMPGNVQCLDKFLPRADAGARVAGALGAGTDFASSMEQSQVAVNARSGGKGEKDFSTAVAESPAGRGADNSPCKPGGGETPKVVNTDGKRGREGILSGKSAKQGSLLSPDDTISGEADKQAEETGVPADIMHSSVAFMAMLNGLVLADGTSTPESGISLLSQSAAAAPGALGSAESQTGGQTPSAQVLQQLQDLVAAVNTSGESANEVAARIGSVIHGSESEVAGTNESVPVAENGNLISGFMDGVKPGDTGRNSVGGKNQTEVANVMSNLRLESLVAEISAGKNIVAAGQTAVAVTHASKPQPGNLSSDHEDSRSGLQTMAEHLLAGTGKKVKSLGDQQLHENPGTSLGATSGQKHTATKIISSQSQGVPVPHSGGQKSQAEATLNLGLSSLSAGKKDNEQMVVNAGGENRFPGSTFPGFEPAAAEGKKPLPVTSDEVLNQVTMRLPAQHNGRQAVTIQLHPESLGKVEIKLVMEQQKLNAHFVVQHPEVRDVLLKHVTSLHDALVAKGVDVKQVAVEIAPPEKMTGMAATVDQHSAGGNQTGGFQQFSPGSDQRQHGFASRDQGLLPPLKREEVPVSPIVSQPGMVVAPGSLHIQA